MDTGVTFYHVNDERAFFEWLARIPCVKRYVGEGCRGLVVYLKRLPRKDELRELLALCHRYGVDMRQLAKFETARNRHWFRDSRSIGTMRSSDCRHHIRRTLRQPRHQLLDECTAKIRA